MVAISFLLALVLFLIATFEPLFGWSSRVGLVALGLFFLTLGLSLPTLSATF